MNRPLPRRHLEFVCAIAADSLDDLCDVLQQLITDASRNGTLPANLVGGGCRSSIHAQLTVNPGVTHESYSAQLDQYLESMQKLNAKAQRR